MMNLVRMSCLSHLSGHTALLEYVLWRIALVPNVFLCFSPIYWLVCFCLVSQRGIFAQNKVIPSQNIHKAFEMLCSGHGAIG